MMSPSIISPFEKLPLLILERICENLDDDSERRRSLWAFSLTSSRCHVAATPQLFCQIQLKIHAPEELESSLKRWTEILTPDDRHRHVRRFKVLWATTKEEERREKHLSRRDGEEADDEEDEEDDEANSDLYHYFDTYNFCRPSKSCLDGSRGGRITDDAEAWGSLSRFTSKLSGLQDMVWEYGSYIPQSVLSIISARGCRLHMHRFHLSSLVQHRDNPQPIDTGDYALVTSPCLYSIVVRLADFEDGGMLNYTNEAVMKMVAGIAPNLAHVCQVSTGTPGEVAYDEALRLGKPAWSGFLSPGTVEPDQLQGLGSLQSLVFTRCSCHDIGRWARLTDFAKLSSLSMAWSLGCGVALAEMATSGQFESLDTLRLSEIKDEPDEAQEALIRLLESLHPLQRLELSGYISSEAFDVVLRRHGRALRNLSIDTYRDNQSQNPLIVFSEATIRRLAEHCPSLEQVQVPVNRIRGDKQETSIYRALGRLPRLRYAFLRLWYHESIFPFLSAVGG